MIEVYRRVLRPAAAVVAACGLASALLLLQFGDPDVGALDPDAVLRAVLGVLVLLGVLPPAVIALRRSSVPRISTAAIFVLAMAAHAVTLSGRIGLPLQRLLAVVATVLSLLLAMMSMFAVAEMQQRRRPQSKF